MKRIFLSLHRERSVAPEHDLQRKQLVASEPHLEAQLQRFCSIPSHVQTSLTVDRIPEQHVQQIRAILKCLDQVHGRDTTETQWQWRPRTYSILRNIGCLDSMETFIQHQLSDFHLPYNEQTLPAVIERREENDLRQAFLDIQGYFLSGFKGIELESSRHEHFNFPTSGDLYFNPRRMLGQGGYGAVDLVFSRESFKHYARKRVIRGRDSENNRKAQNSIIDELRQLKSLRHRHLVTIIGSYTDKEYIAYLMSPVAHGTLDQFLGSVKTLKSAQREMVRRFYGCLAGAVHYLHKNRIRHRDLTTRNILIYNSDIYISDFGSAYSWAHRPASNTRHMNTPVSPDYMAPEVARRDEKGSSSDMWSLGVVFLEMTTRLLGRRIDELRQLVSSHARKHSVEPYIHANIPVVSSWLETLRQGNTLSEHDNEPLSWIQGLLQMIPRNRLSSRLLMKDILESPSFTIFCCFKCHEDFRDGGFAYDSTLPRHESEAGAESMMDTIAAIFQNETSSGIHRLSVDRNNSIEQWIGDAAENTNVAISQQDQYLETIDEDFDSCSRTTDDNDLLYNSYGYSDDSFWRDLIEYPQPHPGDRDGSIPVIDGPFELPGDIAWHQTEQTAQDTKISNWDVGEEEDCDHIEPEVVPDEKQLKDTGFGFLEYDSGSSDHGDDNRLFDEISESSGSSSEYSHTRTTNTSTKASPKESATNDGTKTNQAQPFDEVTDESENEMNSDADVPPHVEPIMLPTITEVGETFDCAQFSITTNSDNGESDDQIKSTPPTTMSGIDELVDDTDVPTQHIESPLGSSPSYTQNNSEQSASNSTVQGEDAASENESPPSPDTIQTNTNSDQKTPEQHHHNINPSQNSSSTPFSQRPSTSWGTFKPTVRDSPLPVFPHQSRSTSWGPLEPTIRDTPLPSGPQRKQDGPKPARPNVKPNVSWRMPPKVTVKMSSTDGHSKSKLSEANLRSLNSEDKPASSPRTPKQRAELPPLNPSLFLKNTWDTASATATSVMSSKTKAKFDKMTLPLKYVDKLENLLREYCEDGESSGVRLLLQHGCNPGTIEAPRRGPIRAAVRGQSAKHNRCVRQLIKHGADVNVRMKTNGKTPLHLAIENDNFNGYVKLIWLLVDNGANTNLPDNNGDKPLMKLFYGPDSLPLEQHRLEALAILLSKDTRVKLRLAGTGNTPLHLAVKRQDKWAVAMLLHKGADVNAKNSSGTTPIQIIANQFRGELSPDHAQVLDLLLKRSREHGVNTIDEPAGASYRTPLHHAVTTGTPEAVAMLLKYGASPTIQDGAGCGAVKLAIQNVEKLVDADPPRLDEHVEIMTLLDRATSSEWPMTECKCPVELAFAKPDLPLLHKLLSAGLNSNQKFRGSPLLHLAVKYRNSAAAMLLIERAAFVDDKDADGVDAIAAAVNAGQKTLARDMALNGHYRRQENKALWWWSVRPVSLRNRHLVTWSSDLHH
ncbi:hypothetical protein F5B20DRAFT_581270 [Whalleya microplaca]|nr:hypothetical protein F5B20DRAFT_581270 [Whalleya microplaca]